MKTNNFELPRVAVMISTYNGQEYLKPQIESLLNQKGVGITLYIRDDGSSDSTLDIIQEYIDNGSPVHLFKAKQNLGPGLSFMSLLYMLSNMQVDADYYAFADQDDIWLENKLAEAVSAIIKEQTECVLYCSNQTLYYNGKAQGLRYDFIPDLTLKGHISKNLIAGCTFVFDKQMFQALTSIDFPNKELIRKRCHDSWIILEALICGIVIYDSDSYILYRIHENNAVGVKAITLKDRFQRFINRDKPMKHFRSDTAVELLRLFPNIEGKNRDILVEFASYRDSVKNKFRLIRDTEITEFTGENKCLFALKVFCEYI